MASTSVTNPVNVEADIVSALLMKPFSVRSIAEQNVIVKERPTPIHLDKSLHINGEIPTLSGDPNSFRQITSYQGYGEIPTLSGDPKSFNRQITSYLRLWGDTHIKW